MINNYLSPQAVSGCSFKKLFVQPYKEGIYNLKLTFSAREKITFITSNDRSRIFNFIRTMHKRVKHLVAATLLLIPVINTITQLFFRLFNRDTNILNKLVDDFANKNSGNFTKNCLLQHAKETLDITKFGLCTKEFESRLFNFYNEFQISALEKNEEKSPVFDNASPKTESVIAQFEKVDIKKADEFLKPVIQETLIVSEKNEAGVNNPDSKPEESFTPAIQTVIKKEVQKVDADKTAEENELINKELIDFVDVFVFPYVKGEKDPLDSKREGLMACAKNKLDAAKLGITWDEIESRLHLIYIEKNIETIDKNFAKIRVDYTKNRYPEIEVLNIDNQSEEFFIKEFNGTNIDFNYIIQGNPQIYEFYLFNALFKTLPIDFPDSEFTPDTLRQDIDKANLNILHKKIYQYDSLPARSIISDKEKLNRLAMENKLFFTDLT